MQLAISVHHRSCLCVNASRACSRSPSPAACAPSDSCRVRASHKMITRRHSASRVAPPNPGDFVETSQFKGLIRKGELNQTSVLEVRCTVAATSTYHSLPETVAVGDGGGSSESSDSGSTFAKHVGASAASSLSLQNIL